MGTEWCVENSLRWCSAHSILAFCLGSSPFLGSIFPRFLSLVQRFASIPPYLAFSPQMTIQPSTYPRRSRRQARIRSQEEAHRTLRTRWRKLERGRKRRSWDMKTVSMRHCRSSVSHRTLSASLGRPRWSLLSLPSRRVVDRCVWLGKIEIECQKKEKEPLTCH